MGDDLSGLWKLIQEHLGIDADTPPDQARQSALRRLQQSHRALQHSPRKRGAPRKPIARDAELAFDFEHFRYNFLRKSSKAERVPAAGQSLLQHIMKLYLEKSPKKGWWQRNVRSVASIKHLDSLLRKGQKDLLAAWDRGEHVEFGEFQSRGPDFVYTQQLLWAQWRLNLDELPTPEKYPDLFVPVDVVGTELHSSE